MNALQKALVNAGFAKEPKHKKNKHKPIACRKCGENMYQPDGDNYAYCQKCGNYIVFNRQK